MLTIIKPNIRPPIINIIDINWVNITTHPFYDISSIGTVRNNKTGILLKPMQLEDRYYRVKLYNNGYPTSFYVHILVAIYHITNPNNLPTVDHIDRNRTNNTIFNLRWASRSEQANNIERRSRKLRKVAMINKHTDETIKIFNSVKDAVENMTGVVQTGISAVCLGTRKTHAGFKWKYIDTISHKCEKWINLRQYKDVEISQYGRVRLSNGRITNGYNHNGYKRVHLTMKDGSECHKLMHRLVAEAMIPNPEKFKCVNHINGNKSDNRVENLEWCSHQENAKHAYQIGANKNVRKIKRIFVSGIIETFPSINEAARQTGISVYIISDILRGKIYQKEEFKWLYDDNTTVKVN